jgi:L-2-hydroxyglutarate oxidase LhgO
VLHEIQHRAAACGVHDLQLLHSPGDVAMLEPYVTAVAALLSPSTGIVDSHG